MYFLFCLRAALALSGVGGDGQGGLQQQKGGWWICGSCGSRSTDRRCDTKRCDAFYDARFLLVVLQGWMDDAFSVDTCVAMRG